MINSIKENFKKRLKTSVDFSIFLVNLSNYTNIDIFYDIYSVEYCKYIRIHLL